MLSSACMRPLVYPAMVLLASFPTCQRFHSVVVPQAESGRTLELRRGQEFGLRLNVSPDPALTWHLVDKGGAVMVSRPVTITASGTQLWRFRADSVRGGTLRMELRRPNDRQSPAAGTFSVVLQVSPR